MSMVEGVLRGVYLLCCREAYSMTLLPCVAHLSRSSQLLPVQKTSTFSSDWHDRGYRLPRLSSTQKATIDFQLKAGRRKRFSAGGKAAKNGTFCAG